MVQSQLAKTIQKGLELEGQSFDKPLTDKQLVQALGLDQPRGTEAYSDYVGGEIGIAYGQSYTAIPEKTVEYMNNMAVKYGAVFIKGVMAQNPYSIFYRGVIPNGGKLEHIVAQPMAPRPFVVQDAGMINPYTVNFGNIHADTFTFLYDVQQDNTILDTVETMYFDDLTTYNDFFYLKWTQLVSGPVIEEMKTVQKLVLKAIYDGKLQSFDATNGEKLDIKNITPTQVPTELDIVDQLGMVEADMMYFDSKYNSLDWQQGTSIADMITLVPAHTAVTVTNHLGANWFNGELLFHTNISRYRMPEFPDLAIVETNHVVTAEDLAGDNPILSPAKFKVNDVIPAGSIAPDGASWGKVVLRGKAIKSIIMDYDVLKLIDQYTPTVEVFPIPGRRATQMSYNQATYMMLVDALNNAVLIDTTVVTPEAEANYQEMIAPKSAIAEVSTSEASEETAPNSETAE